MLKTWYFSDSVFWSAGQWGRGYSTPLVTLLFLICPIKKKRYNKFFDLINAIQINKITVFLSFLLQKSHFLQFCQHSYLHLHKMSKKYLHRTLIFLLPKVYSVQEFIQHTATNNVTNHIPEDILFDVLSNGLVFHAAPRYCIA